MLSLPKLIASPLATTTGPAGFSAFPVAAVLFPPSVMSPPPVVLAEFESRVVHFPIEIEPLPS